MALLTSLGATSFEEWRAARDLPGKASAMWHDMFVIQIPVLEKVLRTVLVYLAIVILFRLAGKRDLATFNTFDFVVIFLLSNVVQNAVIGNDTSVSGGVIGAFVLVAINGAVNRWLAASTRASRVLEGKPTTIIKDGHFIQGALRRLALRPGEVDHAIRMQNGDDVSDIGDGTMEPSGQLVLSLKPVEQSATKGDVAHLNARLDRIDALLAALGGTGR